MKSVEKAQVISGISYVKNRLKTLYSLFDDLTDDELIDSLIYEMISLNAKYKYYLRVAKEQGIRADFFENGEGEKWNQARL